MSTRRRRCPVCHRVVLATTGGHVQRHRDSIDRDVCPMSGQPFELTEMGRKHSIGLRASVNRPSLRIVRGVA